MADTTNEMRAIQLIDLGKVEPFAPAGSPTVERLDARQWLRPAGNSKRFWKKLKQMTRSSQPGRD